MAQERVFPIFLDGAVQDENGTGTKTWNGTSSRVRAGATGAMTLEVGDATVPGTLLMVIHDGTNSETCTVRFASPPCGEAIFNDVLLDSKGEFITAMWTGSEWFFLGGSEDIVVQ